MKKNIVIVSLLTGLLTILSAQQSSLVYPGGGGKLVYEKFANQGED